MLSRVFKTVVPVAVVAVAFYLLYPRAADKEAAPESPIAQAAAATAATAASSANAFDTGDLVLGADQAPVTLIEYASLTCSHCAEFHKDVLPMLKSDYINTGKLRYVFRDFPLDGAAFNASLLSRCAGKNGREAFVSTFMSEQRNWMQGETLADIKEHLLPYGRFAGLTDEQINACLDSPSLKDAVTASRKTGEDLGVNGTPAVFVNGKQVSDAVSADNVRKAVDNALAAAGSKAPVVAPPAAVAPNAAPIDVQPAEKPAEVTPAEKPAEVQPAEVQPAEKPAVAPLP